MSETGRGYPNIDSLKAIAKYFGVTIDELLSGDELLTIAQEETRQREDHLRDIVFGLLDCSAAMLFFLPFFARRTGEVIQEASLLSFDGSAPYLKVVYAAIVIGMILLGILTLALQDWCYPLWQRNRSRLSLIINAAGTLVFVISLQPYAAALLLIFLMIKVLMLIKWP